MIPLSINQIFIASTNCVKICNTNKDEILWGNDVDVVLIEFTLSQITYANFIPVENGQCIQQRYEKEIMDNMIYNKRINNLMAQLNFHLNINRVQVIKNKDKLMMLIINQNKIYFVDITTK